jgi:hypothetical protein
MSIIEIANKYRTATEKFVQVADVLTDSELDTAIVPGWNPRQVIHHLADSEAQSYARLRRLLAEPTGSIIQGYDEAAWAESELLGYKTLPIENSLAVFKAVRAASYDLILRMSESDLDRAGVHTESGTYTVRNWLETYSNHPVDHLEQLLTALGRATS